MRALILTEYGGPDVLHMADLPDPTPSPGDVLVRIHLSGVNPIDLGVRAGAVLPAEPHRFPMVLGWDGAGEVVAVGASVNGAAPGDRVMVLSQQPSSGVGLHADLAAIPADTLAHLPDGVTFAQAAAAPLAAITALNAVEALGLTPGATIHVNNPRGAVGRAAVQIAGALGLRPVADPAPGGADGAVDVRGGRHALAAFARVKDGGAYCTVIPEWWKPGGQYAPSRGITPKVVENAPSPAALARLVGWLANGTLDPEIEATLPLAQGAEAHARMAAPGHTGKLLLAH